MGACSKSTKFARRRPFPCPSPDAQRLGPNAWQPIQHQVRRKKKIIRAQRQALNVASEHNFWNPLVHSRSRDRGNPESNQVTEGSRRGNPACSGGRGLVLGCGKPMPQRQASQTIPPSGAPLATNFCNPVCEEARNPLHVSLQIAVKHTIFGVIYRPRTGNF